MNVITSEVNRFNPRPVTTEGGRGFGIRYPSPFFDISQQFLPSNQHELHKWCRYYFLTNPVINAACSKMAEYPVTPLIFETDDPEIVKLYKKVEDHLKLRSFQVEVGLDYFVYGNAFVSVFLPFEKYLICASCGARYRAKTNRFRYKWRDSRFYLHKCDCGQEGYAKQHDVYIRSFRQIRLVRWNPENIDIKHNEITGKTKYYFRLPKSVINDIKLGDCDEIESLPLEFLEAARANKSLLFSEDNLYHLKRPTIAQKDQGWGTPLIFPLLKDAFYLQVMKKANEAILMENIVPMRMIFPGQNTGGNEGPYGAYNLTNWKRRVDEEINMWKRDHNYIPVLPVNIGFQQIGGQGRALLMYQEMRLLAEQMLAGAGIPVEFIFGGLQWSGSSTSLRALENMFLGYNKQRHELINIFIMGKIASFMEWPKVSSRFDKFRMADDLQRSMFYLQLNQAQKISDHRLMEELGEDFDLESERMREEIKKQLQANRRMQVASADIQGEAQLRTSRYQAKAQALTMRAQGQAQMEMQQAAQQAAAQQQQAAAAQQGAMPQDPAAQQQPAPDQAQQTPGLPEGATAYDENAAAPNASGMPTAMASAQSPLQPGAGGVDLRYIAQRAASFLRTLKKEQGDEAMYQALQQMQTENPPLYQLVIQLMNDRGSQVNPLNAQQNPAPGGTPQADPGRAIG
jgi:hypothetical protein